VRSRARVEGAENRRLAISIGQIHLVLHSPDGELLHRAGQRYARFRAPRAPGLKVVLDASRTALPEPASFVYALDDAVLRLGPTAAHFQGVRHEYALDSLLRILLSVLLLPRRGFLLHAATVIREGKAYVFTGRSGAGKSTVARLSPPGSVLTDEISLLQSTGGAWQAYGTPFWGEFRAEGANCWAPVAGIFSLVQDREDRLEPLGMKEGLRALLPNVLFFDADAARTEQLLQVLVEAVEAIPCHQLHFQRHAGFWKVVAP
jgi:hypothetical protein